MNLRAYFLFIVFAAVAVVFLFLDYEGSMRAYKPSGGWVDAIVVLTGGRGRAEEGLRLFRKGNAAVLILSGVNASSDMDAIFLRRLSDDERGSIILDKRSKSTYENAEEVKRIMDERGFKSMVLITSGYHMKRADYIFRRVLAPDVRIENLSISSPNFDEARWWEPGSLVLLSLEFLKYYWYVGWFSAA